MKDNNIDNFTVSNLKADGQTKARFSSPLFTVTHKLLLIAAAVLITCQSCTQAPTVHPVLEHAERLLDEKADSAFFLVDSLAKIERLTGENYALYALLHTWANDKKGTISDSDSLISKAIAYFESKSNALRLMQSYYAAGRIYDVLRQAPQAQTFYHKALESGAGLGDSALTGRIHSNLGMLYTYEDAYDLAISHIGKALMYISDNRSRALLLRNSGRIYNLLKQSDSAIVSYQKALAIADPYNRSFILNELAGVYAKQEKIDSAYKYVRETLDYDDKIQDFSPVYLVMGKVYHKRKQADSAYYYLHQAERSRNKDTQAGAYYQLYHLADSLGKFSEYSHYQHLYEKIKDSIENNVNTAVVRNSHFIFELNRENEHNQALIKQYELKVQNLIYIMVIAFLIAILFITSFVVHRFYKKYQKNKLQLHSNDLYINKLTEDKNMLEEQLNKLSLEKESAEKRLDDSGEEIERRNAEILRISDEKKKIELKINALTVEIEKRKLQNNRFQQTPIYIQLKEKPQTESITKSEISSLKEVIDELFPDFRMMLKTKCPNISEDELTLCYLLKANSKKCKIAKYFCIESSAISNRCNRFAEKMFGKGADRKDLEDFIANGVLVVK